jgi:hypothetical protein
LGLLLEPMVETFSIMRTTRRPSSITLPNTTCLLSSQSHASHVMKNWQPFVLGPELACRQVHTATDECVRCVSCVCVSCSVRVPCGACVPWRGGQARCA